MRLTVVGCSGSYPGPDSAASCYLVEHDGYRVLLDLGNGALGPLQRHVGLDEIDAVLISHLHSDHYIDLCSYYVVRRYHPAGPYPPLPVVGPARTGGQLARAYDVDPDGFAGVFDFRTHEPVTEVGPFRVTTARVAHPVETYGIRLETGGRVLTYSGDSGMCDALPGLAAGADVLLAEASFVTGEDNPPDLHLTGREAGAVAAAAGVGRLVVTHVPPWYSRDHAAAEASETYQGPVSAAEPRMRIDL